MCARKARSRTVRARRNCNVKQIYGSRSFDSSPGHFANLQMFCSAYLVPIDVMDSDIYE